MTLQSVEFEYYTGLKRKIFRNARLCGSWDNNGRHSEQWTEVPMRELIGEDGCPVFHASVSLDLADQNKDFRWGVMLDGPQGSNFWGIPTEVQDVKSTDRHRQFRLTGAPQTERYYLTYCRRLGANKRFSAGDPVPALRFAVWAPNAESVEVVFGLLTNGYISDGGEGIDASRPTITLSKTSGGIWEGGPDGTFNDFLGLPYMYRIQTANRDTLYRTDIFSRSQIGKGKENPKGHNWSAPPDDLDGTVSCSVVIDADAVRPTFDSALPGSLPHLIPAEEYWVNEFTAGLPVPTRLEDMIIYELHVGALGFHKPTAGDLGDALAFLDHLVDLGINTVELLPMAEFNGTEEWGYGNSHHFCIESSAGGRDKYRYFVRECHRRGIAVIQDVVYNHYAHSADRAEWAYDSKTPEHNIYYWYEGRASDYRDRNGNPFPDGGYVDNGSSGWAPRYWEEVVRQQFISAAAFLIEEMHVDGLRVDLTQAIHRDNRLHVDGREVSSANIFGQKLLREWSRTLHMIRPTAMLIAEEHAWADVTKLPAQGGLGFNARWDVAFYHNLIGDSDMAGDKARLLKRVGMGGNEPIPMDSFSGALYASQFNHVVFDKSHDECGNAAGTARKLVVAVNYAPLIGPTRIAAEARSRVCFGLSALSAGTPMFFMGCCVGAQKPYTYKDFMGNREDLCGERRGYGQSLFRFHQDLISLRHRFGAIRSRNIDILHQSNDNRTIAFKRWDGEQQIIIVASFNNFPFPNGYTISKDQTGIPDGWWREIFNSDAAMYGGRDMGNYGAAIPSNQGSLNVRLPATGFVVLVKQ